MICTVEEEEELKSKVAWKGHLSPDYKNLS